MAYDVFSICLALDTKTTQTVQDIRQTMPASPYRDDTPHVTLLWPIKCPSHMSDKDLLRAMEQLLDLSKQLPLSAIVYRPANGLSLLFGFSSIVLLRASPEMKAYRRHIRKVLQANKYSIGLFGYLAYVPHISIRLGIPYTKHSKRLTKQSFTRRTELTFNKWIILRGARKDGKYLVREIVKDS